MLGKKKQQLAYLKIEWAELKWQIAEAKGSDADPEMKHHYVNDLEGTNLFLMVLTSIILVFLVYSFFCCFLSCY